MRETERTVLALVRGENLTLERSATGAQAASSIMSAYQAWKAFRMGIVASGFSIPESKEAQQAYWRSMRERFNQWYAAYLNGRLEKFKAAGLAVLPPFNPPRREP